MVLFSLIGKEKVGASFRNFPVRGAALPVCDGCCGTGAGVGGSPLEPAWTPPPPSLLVGGARENRPELRWRMALEKGETASHLAASSLSADKETMAEKSRAMLLTSAADCDNLLLEAVGGQRLFVRAPSGARTEKRCQWRLQARDPPRLPEPSGSTAGEKKRCLERIPSSGSSRQATQETGAAIAAAVWSVPRHTKHAKCPSPGAREAGQDAHKSPEKDLASRAL
ncbi:unnamed protein product [Boreogadus saida]